MYYVHSVYITLLFMTLLFLKIFNDIFSFLLDEFSIPKKHILFL